MAGSIARSRISPISSAFHCRERAQTSFSIGKYKGTVAAGGGGLAKRGINFWTMNPANRRTTRGRLLSLSLSLLVSPKLARKRRHVLDGDKRHGETARIRRGRRNDAYETRRLVYVFKLSQRNAERGRRFIPPPPARMRNEKRGSSLFTCSYFLVDSSDETFRRETLKHSKKRNTVPRLERPHARRLIRWD